MQIGLQLDETNYRLFLVGTTHAQGHFTFIQQVMQMFSVQANSYNFSEGKNKTKSGWLGQLAESLTVSPECHSSGCLSGNITERRER